MSPRTDRLWVSFGLQVRDARLHRRWSVRDLAQRAGLSPGKVYRVEAGQIASTDTAARIAVALGRRAQLELIDPRRRSVAPADLSADPVHSAMGELEAAHLRQMHFPVGIDEPYQHFQFAGRADLVAWDRDVAALLHIENRTRFPNFQDVAGSFNAKRAHLGNVLAQRLGITRWLSQTHVIAALWSSEVLHTIRMRRESFRSLCPDAPESFEGWWSGRPPRAGQKSVLIVLDPCAQDRQRLWVGLDEALTVRPRHRSYVEAAAAISSEAASVA